MRPADGQRRVREPDPPRAPRRPRRLGRSSPRCEGRPVAGSREPRSTAAPLCGGARRQPADRVGRLLPTVHASAERRRRAKLRAARRRREPDRRAPCRRAEPHGRRRSGWPRALRLVPRAPTHSLPRRRLPADSRGRLHGQRRHSLRGGVVRRSAAARPHGRELHPRHRRCEGCTRSDGDQARHVSRPGRSRAGFTRRSRRVGRCVHLRRGARRGDRRRRLRGGASLGHDVLAAEPHHRAELHRSRAEGAERRTGTRDRRARDDLALQRRQRL